MSVGSPTAQLCAWTSYSVDPNPTNNQSCNTINSPTTGVSEQALSEIVIYPNPTKGKLFLENLPKGEVSFVIINVRGKRVVEINKISKKTINISSLSNGIYQIKLEGKDWVWNKKLIKQ